MYSFRLIKDMCYVIICLPHCYGNAISYYIIERIHSFLVIVLSTNVGCPKLFRYNVKMVHEGADTWTSRHKHTR